MENKLLTWLSYGTKEILTSTRDLKLFDPSDSFIILNSRSGMAEKKKVKQKDDFRRKCSVGDFSVRFYLQWNRHELPCRRFYSGTGSHWEVPENIVFFHFGFGALKIYDLNHMVDIQHPQQHHQDHLDAGLFGGDQVDSFIIKNIIIKTRPKPAYGRQDLAGSWGSG